MTLRKLVLANERWYLDTQLLIVEMRNSEKRAMTVEEILREDAIGDAEVISFNGTSIYISKEE